MTLLWVTFEDVQNFIEMIKNAILSFVNGIVWFFNLLKPLGAAWTGTLSMLDMVVGAVGGRYVSGAFLLLGIFGVILYIAGKIGKYMAIVFFALMIITYVIGV